MRINDSESKSFIIINTLINLLRKQFAKRTYLYIIIYIFKTRVLNINYDQIPNSNRERKNCFQSTAIQNLSPKCFLAKNIGARFTISSSSPLTRL